MKCASSRSDLALYPAKAFCGDAVQASVMAIWTKDQSKKSEARAMAAALAAANAKACQGAYHPPHPSILSESLHESFRGWNAKSVSA